MTPGMISTYYPESNTKIERFYKSIKGDCLRIETPLPLADFQQIVARHLNTTSQCRCIAASVTSRPFPSWRLVSRSS